MAKANIKARASRFLQKIIIKIKFYFSKIFFKIFNPKVICNICGWKDFRFNSDSWHPYTICPNCNTQVRHRLFWAIMNEHKKYNKKSILKDKAILHFAPEKELRNRINEQSRSYKTADFFAIGYHYDDIDYNTDITDMKNISNEVFDCVIVFDVLEHIHDDNKALREINRILKPGGVAIFTVPQKDNLKITYEDLSIVDSKEREIAFGQFDHLRIYGEDFSAKVAGNGFEAEFIDQSIFDGNKIKKHVLFPPVLSKHPLATNYRKIFFGTKKKNPNP